MKQHFLLHEARFVPLSLPEFACNYVVSHVWL
jgi:hypothetical protein